MNSRTAALLILCLATGPIFVAPASGDTTTNVKSTTVNHTTAPATRAKPAPKPPKPDAEIEKDIKTRMSASKISSHHFQVHVQHGVATLEGSTDVLQHKGTATRLAKAAGATQVVNHIQVSQAAKDKAAKNLASGRRRAQVKRSDTSARSEKRSSQ